MAHFPHHTPAKWEYVRVESDVHRNRRLAGENQRAEIDKTRRDIPGEWWADQRYVDQVVPSNLTDPTTFDNFNYGYQLYARKPVQCLPVRLLEATDEKPPLRYNVKRLAIDKPYDLGAPPCCQNRSMPPMFCSDHSKGSVEAFAGTQQEYPGNNDCAPCMGREICCGAMSDAGSNVSASCSTVNSDNRSNCRRYLECENNNNSSNSGPYINNQNCTNNNKCTVNYLNNNSNNNSNSAGDNDFNQNNVDGNVNDHISDSHPNEDCNNIDDHIIITDTQSEDENIGENNANTQIDHSNIGENNANTQIDHSNIGVHIIADAQSDDNKISDHSIANNTPSDDSNINNHIADKQNGDVLKDQPCNQSSQDNKEQNQASSTTKKKSPTFDCTTIGDLSKKGGCVVLIQFEEIDDDDDDEDDDDDDEDDDDDNENDIDNNKDDCKNAKGEDKTHVDSNENEKIHSKPNEEINNIDHAKSKGNNNNNDDSVEDNSTSTSDNCGDGKSKTDEYYEDTGAYNYVNETNTEERDESEAFDSNNSNDYCCQQCCPCQQYQQHQTSMTRSDISQSNNLIDNAPKRPGSRQPVQIALDAYPVYHQLDDDSPCGIHHQGDPSGFICRPKEGSPSFPLDRFLQGVRISHGVAEDQKNVVCRRFLRTSVSNTPENVYLDNQDPLVYCQVETQSSKPSPGYGTYKIIGSKQYREAPYPNIIDNMELPAHLQQYQNYLRRCTDVKFGIYDKSDSRYELILPTNKAPVLIPTRPSPFEYSRSFLE